MKQLLNHPILKQHLLTILSALAVLVLILPYAGVEATVEVMGVSRGAGANSVSGFSAATGCFFGYFLLAGPALLVAMNYVRQLEKYKGLLAVAVPLVCVVFAIITLFECKAIGAAGAAAAGAGMNMKADVSVSVGIGMILTILVHLITCAAGAMTYHSFKLNSLNLDGLKASGANLFGSVQEKVSGAVHSVGQRGEHTAAQPAAYTAAQPAAYTAAQQPVKKPVSVDRTAEILSLIERLAEMKNAGVLTEEEFSEKKKQLLGEI